MTWLMWNTGVAFFFATIWFMTIVSHPDAEIAEKDWRDEAFGG